jgi:hypothetical protein
MNTGTRPNSRPRYRSTVIAMFVGVVALAEVGAAGQGEASIYGLVTDESGAVLPGVTVTVSSPALQVRRVSAVTATDGEYRVTPLPIGLYDVEYALEGFQTVKQEGVRLTVGFAARLDVKMHVGSLAETVTVTGAAPVVDVTQTAHTTVLTREVLELTPTGRAGVSTLLAQVPGTRALLDIGGSSFNTDPSISSFGQPGEPQAALEGVITRFAAYWNYLTVDEVQATTVGSGAEVETRGVQINAITKSGGNQFHGEVGLSASGGPIQSDNVTDELRAQGITSGGNKVQYRNDVYGDLGGRLKRDKLWFYAAWRETREASEVLDAQPKPDGSPAQSIQKASYFTDKITFQQSAANRVIGFYAWSYKGNVGGVSQFVPWESRTVQHNNQDLAKGEWQMLKGNWLVMSSQYSYWGHAARRIRNENTAPGKIRTQDISTQYVTGPSTRAGQLNFQNMNDVRIKATVYRPNMFLGDHEFKTGFSVTHTDFGRWYPVSDDLPLPNYRLRFQNGAPIELEVPNYPNNPKVVHQYTGFFVQDRWRAGRRLSLNVGIRHAYDHGYAAAACREAALEPAHLVFPAECFPEVGYPVFKPWDPRINAAFDLTGDGKTVLKGGWSAFSHQNFVEDMIPLDPNTPGTARYRWRDLNGNRNYDPGEVNLDPKGPDFITQSIVLGVPNPNLIAPSMNEFMASIERQLRTDLAVRLLGLYSHNVNNFRQEEVLRPYAAYNIPITRPDPGPDARVGTADDPGVNITYFEYAPSLVGQQFERTRYINDPTIDQSFKSVELAVNKQYSHGWQLSAAHTATKKFVPFFIGTMITEIDALTEGARTNPNTEINSTDATWEWNTRFSGSYQLPYGIRFGANYQIRSGRPYARTHLFTGGQTIPSIVLNAEPFGTRRLPNIHIVDLRAEKTINIGAGRRLIARANLFNALNASTVTSITTRSGANFLRPTAIIRPRIAELSASFGF